MSQLLRKVALPIALGLLSGCSTVDGVMDTAGGWVSGSSADSVPKLEPLQAELHPTIQWSETIGEGTSGLIVRLIPQLVDGPLGVTLYSAAVDGTVSAIALPSGKERWHVEYSERIMSGVVVDSHNLYFGSESGQLVALDRESGEERWSLSLLSEILAPVAVAGERVVVRTVDGKISAVNRLSGEKLWHYEREVPVLTLRGTGSPVIVGQQVIVGLDSGEVVALSLEGGREQWLKSVTSARGRTEIERMVDIDADPVVKEDMVYVVGYQGELAALSRTDGALRWKRKVSGVTAPMVYGPYLFLTDQEGN
ncbi:MAG: PQQ-binding-like beta-propeller repeat protein, partial [Gammaproteobacteria bacterium]|nr:PQQ-binding-like beta-propeller repeat protein [Gammaproteobacteria bacterium]